VRTTVDARSAALQLVAAGAQLESRGLILPGEGNLSMRIGANTMLITPTGVDKGRLQCVDLLEVPLDGNEVPARASCETSVHRSVYAAYDHVRAIVHAHPPEVQALSVRNGTPDCELLVEGSDLLGRAALVDRHSPGSAALAAAVVEDLCNCPACVLASHGAVTVGVSVQQAVRRMLLLERLARLTAARLGG